MGARGGPLLLLLLVAAVLPAARARCTWITAFPQLPRPDANDEDFSGQGWGERPLLPAPARDDLCMDAYQSNTQLIHIEEEIPEPLPIATLNYREATPVPYIGVFFEGIRALLEPEIRRDDATGDWLLYINQRQDYERPEMRRYAFQVRVDGEALVPLVVLAVVNIDDNQPFIHVFDTCRAPELGEAPRPTACRYNVTDIDGEISTSHMTFRIDSERGDDRVFGIESEVVEPERMIMTLTLNELLDFEANPLHIFSVTALDSLPNTHEVSLMVQVQNVEHRPPRWLTIWAVQRFDEKTYQNFSVYATDRDADIDRPILYRLDNPEGYPFFWIETLEEGRGGGLFHVSPIDRDALQQEVFHLSIVAYKEGNEDLWIETPVTIIVDDVNDNVPTPLSPVYNISIPEETPLTLNFEEAFGFIDIDLGLNAQYEVRLEDVRPAGAAAAFAVAPDVGYQNQTFVMSTVNHALLDYEVPAFQHIELKFIAQEVSEPSHVGEATVHIYLVNWNDEEPIFERTEYEVRFDETAAAGFPVAAVRAHDRDVGDRVRHSLMGNANEYLDIDEDTGDITVSIADAFDYHRQSELFVQVRADDTLMPEYHTTTTQLVIRLNDINNTPPTLRLPRTGPRVEENVPAGYLVTDEVSASDPDTTADLLFSIDWDLSYATKQGRNADTAEYHGCVEIETIFPVEGRRGEARGTVRARQLRPGVTIDYEMFDMLYLVVRVTDLNTVLNEDSDELTLAVMIIDMNDNAPEWADGTLDGPFVVRERAAAGVVVGSVLATDIDGPLYNQVRYTIQPNNTTPEDLVQIDFYTGQLSVALSGAIDADEPRWHLDYTVIASDCCYADDPADCPPDPTCYNTTGEISIEIIDTNNQLPEVGDVPPVVEIYENALNGTPVVLLLASDRDRDEIYHRLNYAINYVINQRLEAFFAVDAETGQVYVHYTTGDVLDRDRGEDTHRMFFTITDNFMREGDGNRNPTETEVLVRLLDENDNAPELPPRGELYWSVSENEQEGVRLVPDIYAPDIDEPDTDNSRVGYGIEELTLLNRELPEPLPELFRMVDIDNVTGELETAMPLRNYWGSYDIHIWACDYGVPQMCEDEVYELEVRPYNYHAPAFTFPAPGTLVRAARERANENGPLPIAGGELLERIAATDPDGLHAGRVTFEVVGDEGAEQYFAVTNDGDNLGTLLLTRALADSDVHFEVRIRATDMGTEPPPGPRASDSVLRVVFVPTFAEPEFERAAAEAAFFEYERGLEERHRLPLATDPKNYLCTDDCIPVYYHILEGDEEGHFGLESVTNELYVVSPLNRTAAAEHRLTVVASNSPQAPAGAPAAATLRVDVTVREADPRPRFVRPVWYAGISTADNINRELLTLQAYHSEDDTVTYSIEWQTMVAHPSLAEVARSAFALAPLAGTLTLAHQPTASMQGMFEFDVLATDTAGASDRAEVKVYVVSDANRVTFIFRNELTDVEGHRAFIAETFSAAFEMTCNIDQVLPHTDGAGVPLDGMTEVRAHFIQDDVPVAADVIEQIRSDAILLRSIQTRLSTLDLDLWDFVTDASPEEGTDTRLVLLYVLAATSALLMLLCLVLLVAYCVRTRSLSRRLAALSTTKFGSLDSGLNRAGVAVPGTNKHALEGSNPIWNEKIKAPDFDTISEASGDSDLIGVEELPQFSRDYLPPPGDLGFGRPFETEQGVASHSNHFGYNKLR